jgi:nickel-dependent lactate racemase
VLNVVLNRDKDIVASFFGKPDQVMKAGVPLSRSINQFHVNRLYDVVITSPGGYPKDINFYQSQKAITNAARIVRQGGIVILLAACPEGGGSAAYDEFMRRNRTPEDIFFDFDQYGFRVGPHKAYQVAKILQKATIIIVSEMPPKLSELYLLLPAKSLENAMEIAKSQLGTQQINLAILPQGGIALPVYSDMENIINEK